ncbi:hypothetical protein AAHB54_12255, partial [Bacillus cereus]
VLRSVRRRYGCLTFRNKPSYVFRIYRETLSRFSFAASIVKLDNGGLDLIYTLLIANVLIGIATFIVLWSYISTIIQTFTQGFTDF